MRQAEVLQGLRLMKFEELYTCRYSGQISQEQAAEILGVTTRTVRRWEDRFEADGAEGLYDRRLGKLANNRVPAIRLWRCWICSTANTGIIRQSIFTRSLSPTTGLPGATTGYASHYSAMAGSSPRPDVVPIGVNGPAAQWSACCCTRMAPRINGSPINGGI